MTGYVLGILKVPPGDQQLYGKDHVIMDDDKTLQDYGMTSSVAKAQCPATVGLAIRYVISLPITFLQCSLQPHLILN